MWNITNPLLEKQSVDTYHYINPRSINQTPQQKRTSFQAPETFNHDSQRNPKPNTLPSEFLNKLHPSVCLELRSWGADFVFSKHAGVRSMPDDQQHWSSRGGRKKNGQDISSELPWKKPPTHARREKEWETAPWGEWGYSRRGASTLFPSTRVSVEGQHQRCLPCLLMAKTGWRHRV